VGLRGQERKTHFAGDGAFFAAYPQNGFSSPVPEDPQPTLADIAVSGVA